MPRSRFVVDPNLQLEELAAYHDDIVAALRLFFSSAALALTPRLERLSAAERDSRLESRILESDVRSSLAVLTSLEACFRRDFESRCRKRLKDDLSAYFRGIERRGGRVRLDTDILEGWKRHSNAPPTLISQLRVALKFRHWLAHGRYWSPKLGQNYDFAGVYLLAEAITSSFEFEV